MKGMCWQLTLTGGKFLETKNKTNIKSLDSPIYRHVQARAKKVSYVDKRTW